jgi:hypothetical protein
MDEQGLLVGTVVSPTRAILGDGSFTGDGVNNYVKFAANNTCLQASTNLTIEMRIKPTGIPLAGDYMKTVFGRDQGGNYQVSVWRGADWPTFAPPDGVASLALWAKPVDPRGGQEWKPILTDYNVCPIKSDHWYTATMVWDSTQIGGVPASILVDDQGTDGLGGGEAWSGYVDCTDSDQSQVPDAARLQEGDTLSRADGDFAIGASVDHHDGSVFSGLIDWISVEVGADRPVRLRSQAAKPSVLYLPLIQRGVEPTKGVGQNRRR